MTYTKVTRENYVQMIKEYIDTFNAEPNNDEWTEVSAERKWKQVIANPNFEGYMVFDFNNKLIGYIGGVHEVYFIGDTFLIEDFFVIKEMQGSGVGTEILSWFENHLKEKGVVMIRFFTANTQKQQGFYEKRNYQNFDEIVMMGKELL